jgi:hypothetical protein
MFARHDARIAAMIATEAEAEAPRIAAKAEAEPAACATRITLVTVAESAARLMVEAKDDPS